MSLTYAGNLENLKDIEKADELSFSKANILEAGSLKTIFVKTCHYRCDTFGS